MKVRPITLRAANEFVAEHHRHNKPVQGCRFCLAAYDGDDLVGVAIVGRPVARRLDDGLTAEVVRCCTKDGAPKGACSFLYGAARRVWQAMGGAKVITYTLQTESGSSLRGAGWDCAAAVPGNTGKAWQSRPGRCEQAVVQQAKFRWEAA